MHTSTENFLGMIDQFTQKLGPIDLLIDKLARQFSRNIEAAAVCDGDWCHSTFQCVPGCVPPNGWWAHYYDDSNTGPCSCVIAGCSGCCCSW